MSYNTSNRSTRKVYNVHVCINKRFERYVYSTLLHEIKGLCEWEREQNKAENDRIKTHGTHLFIMCPVSSLQYVCVCVCSYVYACTEHRVYRALSSVSFIFFFFALLSTNITIIIILLYVVILVSKVSFILTYTYRV